MSKILKSAALLTLRAIRRHHSPAHDLARLGIDPLRGDLRPTLIKSHPASRPRTGAWLPAGPVTGGFGRSYKQRAMILGANSGRRSMNSINCQISISLDGYVAGPNQSSENPIGEGGMGLHEWAFQTASWREQQRLEGGERSVDSEIIDEVFQGVGAYIMGRKMFGGGDGPWDETWTGWWGDDPPFHAPVFVLTHHAREPLPMQGGTTFTFVTDGIESALEQARTAAGDKDVAIAGGASAVQQYLAAGLLDELYLHIVPIILGAGERLLEHVGDPTLEPVKVVASPAVTHIKYRVVR